MRVARVYRHSTNRHSRPRWATAYGYPHCRRNRLCVECGGRLKGRRRSWCSAACVEAYRIRAHPSYARHLVLRRDRGVCQHCGLQCLPLEHAAWGLRRGHRMARQSIERLLRPHGMAQHWRRKSFWDADHIVAVADGGGECGIENLRTLCLKCHGRRTRQQARSR